MELNKLVASSIESEIDGVTMKVSRNYMEDYFGIKISVLVNSNYLVFETELPKSVFVKLKENMEHVLK